MTADGILNGWARSLKVQREDQTGITVGLAGDQASPGFFSTTGISLLRGRTFTDADSKQPFAVVIIGDTLAHDLLVTKIRLGGRSR